MSYQVRKLPNEPIILTTLFQDYKPLTEITFSMRDTLQILDAATEPMIIVLNLLAQLNMEQIIYGITHATRSERPTWTHPNTRQVIVVTTHPMGPILTKRLRSFPFRVDFVVMSSLDDALRFARAQIYA
jgi:hypothetical protein